MYLTTEQLSKGLHCSRKNIGYLRKYGLLKGMKTGHGYIYSEDEIKTFYDRYSGNDLNNEQRIRINKKAGVTGYERGIQND